MLDLRQWRKAQGITQAQAANRLAVTERHYRRLETGKAPINRRLAMLAHMTSE